MAPLAQRILAKSLIEKLGAIEIPEEEKLIPPEP